MMRYFISKNKYSLIHVNCGSLLSQGKYIHQKRKIDTFVIILCVKGTLYIAQDDVKYALKENQFIILFADHLHYGYKESESELTFYWCHFSVEKDDYEIINSSDMEKLFVPPHNAPNTEKAVSFREEHFSEFYILPEFGEISTNGRAILIYRQLLDLARNNCYSEKLVNYTLSVLALEISQEYIERFHFNKKNKKLKPNMEKIIEWARINYCLHLPLSKIAHRFNYNPKYLSLSFREYTGMPLMRYITAIRI
ncbi:MAG: AraC family ligand binding domain-containing protein [Treponema sp.]|jgi:YesN/AraC family two-component response regulator|nr:AraC family ligand binding domain-containing protein [Treponema sp.]